LGCEIRCTCVHERGGWENAISAVYTLNAGARAILDPASRSKHEKMFPVVEKKEKKRQNGKGHLHKRTAPKGIIFNHVLKRTIFRKSPSHFSSKIRTELGGV
jgi:hypothetical protein